MASFVYFHLGDNDEYISWWHFPFQAVYLFVFALYCAVEFDSLDEFLIVWLIFIVLESFSVFVAVVDDSIRLLFYAISYMGDGRHDKTIETGQRIMGLGIIASDGSLTLSTGIMSLVYLRLRDKIKDIIFIALLITILSATMFIGRTGVLVELAVVVAYIILARRFGSSFLWGALTVLAISFLVSFFIENMSGSASDKLQEWMSDAFDRDSQTGTLDVATGTGFSFNNHFLLGNAGLMRGSSNGFNFQSDSGYVKMYYAVGLVGMICYYFGFVKLFLSARLYRFYSLYNKYLYFLVIIAFIVEYKEPYFMKLRLPWVILTFLIMSSKDQTNSIRLTLINNEKDY